MSNAAKRHHAVHVLVPLWYSALHRLSIFTRFAMFSLVDPHNANKTSITEHREPSTEHRNRNITHNPYLRVNDVVMDGLVVGGRVVDCLSIEEIQPSSSMEKLTSFGERTKFEPRLNCNR